MAMQSNGRQALVVAAMMMTLLPAANAVGTSAVSAPSVSPSQKAPQTDATRPSGDDLERLSSEWEALLAKTGALGSYVNDDGTILWSCPHLDRVPLMNAMLPP